MVAPVKGHVVLQRSSLCLLLGRDCGNPDPNIVCEGWGGPELAFWTLLPSWKLSVQALLRTTFVRLRLTLLVCVHILGCQNLNRSQPLWLEAPPPPRIPHVARDVVLTVAQRNGPLLLWDILDWTWRAHSSIWPEKNTPLSWILKLSVWHLAWHSIDRLQTMLRRCGTGLDGSLLSLPNHQRMPLVADFVSHAGDDGALHDHQNLPRFRLPYQWLPLYTCRRLSRVASGLEQVDACSDSL